MKQLFVLSCLLLSSPAANAQVDTINTTSHKLNLSAFKEGKQTYAVFFEDSTGKRLGSADLWDRSIRFSTNAAGQKLYQFSLDWYRKDTLIAQVTATGQAANLAPLTHTGNYFKRGERNFVFNGATVTVPAASRRTAKDSTFNVVMKPTAFEFPMDLEILPLLPFKKVGQQFAVAFYEPGSPSSNYYRLTVEGKENLLISGNTKISCWLLKIDYGQQSHATFWIADQAREVLKMREYFRGRYRYKVKLY
ncbi:hypothetical protein [Spirosoma fluminis]